MWRTRRAAKCRGGLIRAEISLISVAAGRLPPWNAKSHKGSVQGSLVARTSGTANTTNLGQPNVQPIATLQPAQQQQTKNLNSARTTARAPVLTRQLVRSRCEKPIKAENMLRAPTPRALSTPRWLVRTRSCAMLRRQNLARSRPDTHRVQGRLSGLHIYLPSKFILGSGQQVMSD